MAKIQTFKDLLVWNKAHEMTLCVYRASAIFSKEELYSLTSQVRRAAVSVSSNIKYYLLGTYTI